MKPFLLTLSFLSVVIFMSGKYIFSNPAAAQSVMGVSHSLACPCECPMVLEDCHMSCGLEWKNVIASQLKAGSGKEDVVAYFYKRYGNEALLTPTQRIAGKWYQITRGGYPVKDMILFGMIVLVWTAFIYLVSLTAVEQLLTRRKS